MLGLEDQNGQKRKMAGAKRRHATLLKKAQELSTLCDAEVALISFTQEGKLHEFSCHRGKKVDIEKTLLRYSNHPKGGRATDQSGSRGRQIGLVSQKNSNDFHHQQALRALKGQHATLELEMSRRMGRNLEGLSKEKLDSLEHEQKDALISVLKKKEELLVGHLMRAKEREHIAIKEKEEALMKRRRREVPCLLQLFPEKSGSLCTMRASNNDDSHLDWPNEDMDIDVDLRLKL